MVRVLNFFCVALMSLSILALYQVSEKTRVAQMRLDQVRRQISQETVDISVLQTEWQHVAAPDRIQQLAQATLGMNDSASVQLSSFDQIPRRGSESAPLNNTPLRNASAQLPVPQAQSGSGFTRVANSDTGM